jgi:hypothetical protein
MPFRLAAFRRRIDTQIARNGGIWNGRRRSISPLFETLPRTGAIWRCARGRPDGQRPFEAERSTWSDGDQSSARCREQSCVPLSEESSVPPSHPITARWATCDLQTISHEDLCYYRPTTVPTTHCRRRGRFRRSVDADQIGANSGRSPRLERTSTGPSRGSAAAR